MRWTASELSDRQAAYLGDLPLTIELDGFTIVHGSPRDPLWEYVKTPEAAVAAFEGFSTARCIVGHSHIAFPCRPEGGTAVFGDFPLDDPTQLGTERLIFNPGAVGQPRDRDPRASYAIYDSTEGTICRRRIAYDVASTQQKMRDREMPRYLVERLAYGL